MTPSSARPRGRRAAAPARLRLQRPSGYVLALWLVAIVVVLVDQLTKAWAASALADGHRVALLGDLLGLVLVRNPGAAFSFATGQTWIFTVVAVVVTVIVLRASRRLASRWWAVTLGLVLGGAVGNLIDRLVRSPGVFRGHVVDFIDYGGYFVGNVADIAIVVAEIHLETGRTHQIRVHMSAVGHPCVGDETYGADAALSQRTGLVRQWLHAHRLGLAHPITGEWMTFVSPYPDDLVHALEVLRYA